MLLALAISAAISGGEASIPKASGDCGVVRGRLDLWNGGTPVQIWVVGTHRKLGVVEPVPEAVSELLDKAEDRWAVSIFGNYKVCAVTPSRVGHRQSVTVVAADGLDVRRRD